MRVRLSAGRAPAPSSGLDFVGPRARALEAALTASGAPALVPTYDMTRGSNAERLFKQAVMQSGFSTADTALWPHDGLFVAGLTGEVFREGAEAFYRLPDGQLALVQVGGGWAKVTVAAPTTGEVEQASAMFQTLYPATYLDATDDRVALTFWMLGPHGPERFLRMIDTATWDSIRRNYTGSVQDEVDGLMDSFEPGKGGQLLLWQGPPGTGKTWALRALMSRWLPWAEFHYVTDPDAFFVESAKYMVSVLLSDSYEAIHEPTGDVVSGERQDKWRVLILEDTGELLSAGAKEKYGQGLSRLLNVCEGLIGQGLRILVLVTTNDELGELNAAVRRPGRCASQIVFSPMTAAELADWAGDDDLPEGTTLAELYHRRPGEAQPALALEQDDEDAPDPGEVVATLQRVAEEHAPEGGYGDTYWNAADGKVFWVCGDWTSNEEADAAVAAFSVVRGVTTVDYEAEAGAPSGDGWAKVWPEQGSDLAYDRVLALARRPLDL